MFTLNQIEDIHHRYGNQNSLVEYLQALKNIGVIEYDSFVSDGHSEYHGEEQKIVTPTVHANFQVELKSNPEEMQKYLNLHSEGKINYLEMSKGLAESGVEKWTFNTVEMNITYYGKDGSKMLVEPIG